MFCSFGVAAGGRCYKMICSSGLAHAPRTTTTKYQNGGFIGGIGVRRNMEISAEGHKRLNGRLTDTERPIVEGLLADAWENRSDPKPTDKLAVVALEVPWRTTKDGSNGTLVIGVIKMGTLATVFLRNESQLVKANKLEANRLKWLIPKRPTGPKARKFLNRRR